MGFIRRVARCNALSFLVRGPKPVRVTPIGENRPASPKCETGRNRGETTFITAEEEAVVEPLHGSACFTGSLDDSQLSDLKRN
jgi:hypothetical protein